VTARFTTIADLAAAIAATTAPLLSPDIEPNARGLYLATGDAGIDVAVTFWAEALASSPRFANPADFPWTLANAPAGAIARALDIRGPCFTLVGGAEAMIAVLARADQDLARGRVREAVVVGCDLAEEVQAGMIVVAKELDSASIVGMSSATETLLALGGRTVVTAPPE